MITSDICRVPGQRSGRRARGTDARLLQLSGLIKPAPSWLLPQGQGWSWPWPCRGHAPASALGSCRVWLKVWRQCQPQGCSSSQHCWAQGASVCAQPCASSQQRSQCADKSEETLEILVLLSGDPCVDPGDLTAPGASRYGAWVLPLLRDQRLSHEQ